MANAESKDGKRAPRNSTSDNGKGEAVFEVHGKHLVYCRTSLYLFGEGSRVRLACVRTVAHPWFERLVLLLILLNSIVLALVDWSVIDEDPSSEDVGEPIAEGSWRNAFLYETEIFFTVLFTLEFVLKVIAKGFIFGRGAYLRDSWNVLDFLVVVTSLMISTPGMPKTSVVRVFRVLRPLRSISALPGLQHLVVSLLRSVPQLVSVVILLQFIFVVFGIFGVQIFAGKQHSRCRLTPYPVTTAFEIGMNYTDHRCLEASNFDTVGEETSWTQSSSPWSTPRECYWPLDTEDTRLCAFDSSSGDHKCDHDPLYMNETDFRWCGSDYDALGNRRFAGGVIGGVEWGAADLAANATFVEDLAWGYTTFDNIFKAFLTIFQSITLEGWSDILYQMKDCSLPVLADLFFIVLVLWGAFFTLNLLLAVLESNFSQDKDNENAQNGQSAGVAVMVADEEVVNVNVHDNGDAAAIGAAAEERTTAAEEKVEDTLADIAWRFVENGGEGIKGGGGEGRAGVSDSTSNRSSSTSTSGTSSTSSTGESEGGYPGWRLALRRLASSEKFQRSVTVLIVLNTLVLALDHHPIDDEFATVLEACNLVFTLCFALEMVFKLVALGPRRYAEDRFNLFDALIVVSSLVELALSPPGILTEGAGGDAGGGLSALRSLRVFRVFKLARGWSSMRDLLETLRKTLLDIGNFGLLLLLFMFVYILIGVQFFANRFHFGEDGKVIGIGEEGYHDAEVPRSNFDTLLHAFVTVFEVLTGENWNATMYSARRAVGWVSVFYFVSLIIFGMMIMMSLFLAIVLSHFSTPEEDGVGADEREEQQRQLAHEHHHQGNIDTIMATDAEEQGRRRQREGVNTGEDGHPDDGDGRKICGTSPPELFSVDDEDENIRPGTAASRDRSQAHPVASAAPGGSVEDGRFDDDDDNGRDWVGYAKQRQQQQQQPSNSNSVETANDGTEGNDGLALCCLSAKNPLRRSCVAIVSNIWFDRFITLLIVVSSVELALDNPLDDPNSTMSLALKVVELVTTVLFTAEFLLKVCASGFYFMPLAYLRDPWNVLDFIVVVASVSYQSVASGPPLPGLRSLRALRALRPLRIINRLPGLKLVLEVLLHSIPGVINVAAVCFVFYIIVAILSVNYFKGVLMSCQGDAFDALPAPAVAFLENPSPWSLMTSEQREWFGPLSNISEAASSLSEDECVAVSGGLWPDSAGCCPAWPSSAEEAPTSFEVCECLGLEWGETIPQQFNNVAVALLTLFEISTTEAWTSVTYAAVDSTSEDMQPIRDNVLLRVWFFILFMLVGAYLVLNLFVGVVVENFEKMKAHVEGSLFLTDNQRSWTKTQMILHRLKPRMRRQPPADPVGGWCFRLVHRTWFDPTVMVLIALNTVVMAIQYFGQSTTYTWVLLRLNYTFFVLFALEALVKILALRWAYFKDSWNRFDLFVVCGSTTGLLALFLVGSSYGSIVTIIRVFRVGRVLRLVEGLESMAQLFSTLLMTLLSLGNVGCLLCLLFFVYATVGEQLYAKVALEGAVTSQANFRSFWDTMVLLLRFSTGENWNGFMYDMAANREGCVSDPEYDPDVCGFTSHANCIPINGCGVWSIFPYLVSFTFIITFVFLNLFIGVILDGFDNAKEESEGFITQEDFQRFADHWARFDPHATCLVSVPDLHAFLQTLFKPWGFGVEYQASGRELRQKVRRLNLHVFDGNRVHFKDVLRALSEEVYRTEAAKMGESKHLQESYKVDKPNKADRWKIKKTRSSRYMVNPVSNATITFDQILAVEYLQQAFRRKVAQRNKDRAETEAAVAATTVGAGAGAGAATASNNTNTASVGVPPFAATEDEVKDEEAKGGEGAGIDFAGGPAPAPGSE